MNDAARPPTSKAAAIFAILAIAAGLMALAVGVTQGRRAGYEMMMMYTGPAVVCALIGIAIQRRGITYAGLAGGLLAIVGMVLGQ